MDRANFPVPCQCSVRMKLTSLYWWNMRVMLFTIQKVVAGRIFRNLLCSVLGATDHTKRKCRHVDVLGCVRGHAKNGRASDFTFFLEDKNGKHLGNVLVDHDPKLLGHFVGNMFLFFRLTCLNVCRHVYTGIRIFFCASRGNFRWLHRDLKRVFLMSTCKVSFLVPFPGFPSWPLQVTCMTCTTVLSPQPCLSHYKTAAALAL